MARDSSGNYTLPAGNPVATGTIISTTWANPTMADLAAEITNSLDRNGRGGMLVPFQNADGTVILPGITFTNEIASGLYRAGLHDVRMANGSDDTTRWIDASLAPIGERRPFEIWNGEAWQAPISDGDSVTVLDLTVLGTTTLGAGLTVNSGADPDQFFRTNGSVLEIGNDGVVGLTMTQSGGIVIPAVGLRITATASVIPNADGEMGLYGSLQDGAVVRGQGSTNDVSLMNTAGAIAARIPAGTVDFRVGGAVQVAGGVSSPATPATAQLGTSAGAGVQLMGNGTTYDVTLMNRTGSTALGVIADTNDVRVVGALDLSNGEVITPGSMTIFGSLQVDADATFEPSLYLRATLGNGSNPRIRYTGNQNFAIRDDTAAVDRLQIGATGIVTIAGPINCGADVTAFSDRTLKDDFNFITDSLDKVSKLFGYTYRRIDLEDDVRRAGLMAQDVQAVLPEAVIANGDGILALNDAAVTGLLVNAINELRGMIDDLAK